MATPSAVRQAAAKLALAAAEQALLRIPAPRKAKPRSAQLKLGIATIQDIDGAPAPDGVPKRDPRPRAKPPVETPAPAAKAPAEPDLFKPDSDANKA